MTELEARMAAVDAALRPIAKAPIDISDPGWQQRMRELDPLAEAGVREEAQAVLEELLARYAAGEDAERQAIRDMFARHSSFTWAVHVPREQTEESFRWRLVAFSARDQYPDTRDELLRLGDWAEEARAAGVDVAGIARAVAAMSSDVDRYGMGSTRSFLEHLR